jgi:hypothetical protein
MTNDDSVVKEEGTGHFSNKAACPLLLLLHAVSLVHEQFDPLSPELERVLG